MNIKVEISRKKIWSCRVGALIAITKHITIMERNRKYSIESFN